MASEPVTWAEAADGAREESATPERARTPAVARGQPLTGFQQRNTCLSS